MASTKNTKFTQVNSAGEIEEHPILKEKIQKRKMGIPGQYLDLGMYLALPLILAVLIGQFLDRKFQTKAMFTISLLIFGTISVFYNLYKLYSEDVSRKRGKS